MPVISVIVPFFNSEQYLDKCIGSVIDQDYKDFELILVDDGSSDGGIDICRKWAEIDHRIVITQKKNGGLSDARNHGIEMAKGKYVTFIDSDDYISSDYLSYLLSLFSLSNNCLITSCNRQLVRNGEIGSKFNYINEEGIVLKKREAYEKSLYTEISHGAWARLYRREVFDKLRFPVGILHEDTYILGDFIRISDEMVFGDKVCYYYVVHQTSIVHTKNTKRLIDLIESTRRLANMASEYDATLINAGICKISDAIFSSLAEIDLDSTENKLLAKKWKKELLSHWNLLLFEKRNLFRDRIGILVLIVGGIPLYKAAYRIYEHLFKW